jgi:thymidine phosphorylase
MAAGGLAVGLALTGCTSTAATTGSVPKGFPDAVPLASRSVVDSSKTVSSWDVTVKVDTADAQKKAVKKLTNEGFAVIGQDKGIYSLASSVYSVRLALANNKDGYTVDYAVAKRPALTKRPAPAKTPAPTKAPAPTK